jgi:hypothetical protein
MKKYLLILLVIFSTFIQAQDISLYPKDGLNRVQKISNPFNDPYRGAQIKNWYDYGGVYSDAYGASVLYVSDFLFPDTAKFDYIDGVYRSFYYKMATVIDPTAKLFNTYVDLDFNEFVPYYVDSVYIPFVYHRNTTDDIRDTLIVEVGSDSLMDVLVRNTPDLITSFGYSSVEFEYLKFIAGPDGIGEMEAPKKQTIKVVMDKNWITNNTQKDMLTMALPLNLPRFKGNENIFVAIYFKPGFSYNVNDTITRTGNSFQTIMWEEQGLNTFPEYHPGEFNCSYFANYINLDPGMGLMYEGFFPYYTIPAWPKNLPEHFGFGVNLRYDEAWLGVHSINTKSDVSCFPNPASNTLIVKYSLENSENVAIKIYSIDGKLILNQDEGMQSKGVHSSEINIQNLHSGIYLYSVNGSTLQKLVVE